MPAWLLVASLLWRLLKFTSRPHRRSALHPNSDGLHTHVFFLNELEFLDCFHRNEVVTALLACEDGGVTSCESLLVPLRGNL